MICQYCKTNFVNKYTLAKHIKTSQKCLKVRGKQPITIKIDTTHYEVITKELDQLKEKLIKKDIIIDQLIQQLDQKDKTISRITKKQSRPQFKDQNVIYVLTTPFLKQSDTYIIGKAINLTTRLSTYNKSDEHEVVYYKQCKDEYLLVTTETIILDKLKEYKENGNRDRITIPKDKTIENIIETINETILFINGSP